MSNLKKAMELEKEYNKLKGKFFLTEKEVKIYRFFNSLQCEFCGKKPTTMFPSHKVGNHIYCYFCYNNCKSAVEKMK